MISELHIEDLRHMKDEFKNLDYWTLMAILEVIYEQSKIPDPETEEQILELQSDIDDLEQKLEDSDYEYSKLEGENLYLTEEVETLKGIVKELEDKLIEAGGTL